MPIANYTSKVAARQSINEITVMLVKAGARAVATEYDEGQRPTNLTFAIVHDGVPHQYALPVRPQAVLKVLREQGVPRTLQTPEHAERVAWRILRDWIRAQLAILETEMVSLGEIMLPYLKTDTGATVFERWEAQRQLPAGSTL